MIYNALCIYVYIYIAIWGWAKTSGTEFGGNEQPLTNFLDSQVDDGELLRAIREATKMTRQSRKLAVENNIAFRHISIDFLHQFFSRSKSSVSWSSEMTAGFDRDFYPTDEAYSCWLMPGLE